ncbi:MAG: hypothetical protein WCL00_09535, partial [Bacteroidota bacterium]
MAKIDSQDGLRNAILQLEMEQIEEGIRLKEHLHDAIDGMKPINLIRNTLKSVVGSNELKEEMVVSSIGLGAGLVSKLVIAGMMKSPLRKVIGTAVMLVVTHYIERNPDKVKSMGMAFFNL